ncbi:hypothetical protein Poli38472_007958 [Pythium oligandrum]|uniref:Uncharacterized protein n=1 Tax=Pythium oligandrum TaxID=41045 RepID=A0A8K1CKJ7_PYTOL|nr:hypothetical protein Poli38472_007958 [Pythium oligandrum]|eukprot:TMW65316.1 hypothetical protein Poli38472_007958 [Pythium oligandrum]
MIDGIVVTRRDQARILEQTLQLLFACEVLLFVEYMEVVIPFLYALCLGLDWLLPNGQYNLVVRGMSDADVTKMLTSSFFYALLELLSMLAMYYVMKTKYGVSAFCQLTFVLEEYWLTLQGKLVGAFIVIWNAATVHQGTDFH